MQFTKLIAKGTISRFILFALCFLAGASLGLFLWDKICLPFQNPWEIVGPLTQIQYNPLNDSIRFALFLTIPPGLLLASHLIGKRQLGQFLFPQPQTKIISPPFLSWFQKNTKIATVLLIVFSILIALNTPTYHSSEEYIDTFHEGESLGPAMSYLEGKAPYQNFLFAHGLYQDPLRSVLAFKLFGKSIGAVRTLESLNKIFAFILLGFFLLKLYRRNYLYSFTCFLVLIFLQHTNILPIPQLINILPRETTTFFFLINLLILQNLLNHPAPERKNLFLVSFFLAFIPILSFGYSIDRGLYLLATYAILSPLLYFLFFHQTKFNISFLTANILGFISSLALLSTLLRGGFLEFLKYTFLTMPRYKELLDGAIYPIDKEWFLLIILLIAANLYWLSFKFLQELHFREGEKLSSLTRRTVKKYLLEITLLLISVFFFRSALGRSDWEHVAYSTTFTFILSIHILLKYHSPSILNNLYLQRGFSFLVIFAIISAFTLGTYNVYHENLLPQNFPLKIHDSEFIPDDYKAAISFLKNNLKPNENFITLTSEGSWYYFLDKPSFTRFPIVWFAAPNFYQQEIVEDLEQGNVKFILYQNNHWANHMDNLSNEERLPILTKHIRQNYEFCKKIDQHEIWIKEEN